MRNPHMSFLLLLAVIGSVTMFSCDKLNGDKELFEDQVATSNEGGKAVMDNVLLITDIGLALADTSRFGLPTALAKHAGRPAGVASTDTCILDTTTDQWTCSAEYELSGGVFSATLLLEFQKNFNGYPLFVAPFIDTDTANIVLTANDSFDVTVSRELFVDISATHFEITGFDDWITSGVAGALTFNGALNFNARAELGRNTPGVSGDDVTFDITYEQSFSNVRINEGSTLPASGTVGFVITQDVTPNPDGVSEIAGDFSVTGSITFAAAGITMTINGHSYAVTVNNGTVSITPL